MRKEIGYFLSICFLISSCALNKIPIFRKVATVEVLQFTPDTLKLKATAIFTNPNRVSGQIAADQIHVFINATKVASVSAKAFKVPAKKEFTLPLLVEIPTKKIWENNKNGLLGGLLNSVVNKSIKVQFKGDLKYKVFGFSKVYKIDKTEVIPL